ncbi:site-specific integrase [Sphingobium estronivorans]|uniref:site-specific integrase n=1 Tax=Sphingobium estronivorans TaxID=1577690 RepID=UPI001239156A|nr:site-specific integrase [Sphingobium estronivorans]
MPVVSMDATFVLTATCPPDKRKVDYYSDKLSGFILEVRANGGKSFHLRYKDSYGRLRQMRIGPYPDISFEKAKREATKIRSRVVVGENPLEEKQAKRLVPTVQELSVRYLDYVRNYKRSHANDERALRNHILPRFGRMRLDELEPEAIAAWFRKKVEEGLSPASVNFLHVVLGYMFKLAAQWKIPGAEVNPLGTIPHFQANNARERYLTAAETERVKAAIEASPNRQLRFIVPLLLLTGARKRELLDAKWEHFDLEQRRWRIPHSKNGKARHVPLSQAALDVLAKVPRWEGCSFVVPNPQTKLPYKDVFYVWNKARIEAGVPDVRLHDLRHTFASNVISNGQSLYVVGQILGHARVTTSQRYSHLSQESLLLAADVGAAATGIDWTA